MAPKHFAPRAGTIYQVGRLTVAVKTTAVDNDGAYTLCEALEPGGFSAALHRHATYDETHIICEGQYECQLGDEHLTLGPGDIMFVPRGTAHSIKNIGTDPGRELMISSPGGVFDAFIKEVAAALGDAARPNTGPGTDFRAIAAKYGIEFLA